MMPVIWNAFPNILLQGNFNANWKASFNEAEGFLQKTYKIKTGAEW